MADQEQIRELVRSRAPFSTWLGVVLLFFLFGAIVLAVIGPSPRGSNYEQERAKQRAEKVKSLQDDAKSLTSYAWIDKNKGTARIPLERAMELTLVDLANRKPALAGPIATPPAAAAAPAGSSPAASASPKASGTPKPTSVAGPQSENRGQPAAATNPAPVQPGSQPGANATPATSPAPQTVNPPVQPASTPTQPAPGSPLPVRGKQTPSPSPRQ